MFVIPVVFHNALKKHLEINSDAPGINAEMKLKRFLKGSDQRYILIDDRYYKIIYASSLLI